MTIGWETAQSGGGAMRAYLGLPDSPGPHPGVVIAHHAFGIDASMQDMAHRLVREGYAAVVPDVFHRQPAGLERLQRTALLRDAEILQDVAAASALLRGKSPSLGALGMMGFCMGGRVAYLAACGLRGFDACAVFYGGNVMKALGEGPSPFERSAGLECPLIGFFGVEDSNPSQGDVAKFDAELTRLGKWHEFHSYRGAGHAFHNFTDERYRERAARASWHELLAFFSQVLKRGAKP